MGKTISYLSALYSVLWMTFIFILLLFPAYPSPNAQQMNYAIVVIGFVFIFCVVNYYLPGIGGKTFFTGPIRTIDEIIGSKPELEADLERKVLEDRVQNLPEKEVH
jgi:hypothetical protein